MPLDLNTIYESLEKNPPKDKHDLNKWKRTMSRDFDMAITRDNDILKNYLEYCKKANKEPVDDLIKLFKRRSIRTLSGVAPITVLTKPFPCPGQCVYCPTEARMPKSYLSNEPAAMRALMLKFDPYKQVRTRLQTYKDNAHSTDKCELIVLGGTWSAYPRHYQTWFTSRLYEALNDGPEGNNLEDEPKIGIDEETLEKKLLESQKINQTAKNRAVGLCLETRSDHTTPKEVARMRMLGTTRVQVGVQNIDQKILDLIKRNETVKQVVQANKLFREAGFKVDMHFMPNLPGATLDSDLKMFEKVFSSEDYKPDQLKIYPTIVNKLAELYSWYKEGRWQEYSPKDLLELCVQIKSKHIPYYTRINRLVRDIPKESIESGNSITNLRQYIQKEMKTRNLRCKCIRCREARNRTANLDEAKLFTEKYNCVGGKEYFISYENDDRTILYAFVRLRIPKDKIDSELADLLPDIKNAAHIRELHTYGKLVPIGEKKDGSAQHAGFGRRLMSKAEEIVKKQGIKKIAIIAGVGVREYYKKLGYELEDTYMTKKF